MKLKNCFLLFSFFAFSAGKCDDVHPCQSNVDCLPYTSMDSEYYCGEYAGKSICIPTNPVMQQRMLAGIGSNTPGSPGQNLCDVPHEHTWGNPGDWSPWSAWKGNCKFRSRTRMCTFCGTNDTQFEQVPPGCFM